MATSSGTLRPLSVHAMIRCRQSPVAQPITPTGLGSASIQRCLSFCCTDNMLMAPRIAEHLDIRLPVMVCLDGFVISHSIETMHIEDDQRVRGFIGGHRLCAGCPVPIITKMLPCHGLRNRGRLCHRMSGSGLLRFPLLRVAV
jgi:pyruvate/2-oxoacid:ferredoxin oxidoreductase alpha subunit